MTAEGPESGKAQPPTDSPPAAQARKASSRVFVSYASQDATVAADLVEALERHGVVCWIAPRDVKAGAVYADAIVRAISDAEALVLLLSANSVASAHVGKEVERASSKRRPLIALRIDDAPLSPALEYFLGESHWVDARAGGMDAALTKLIAAIREPERNAPGIIPPGTPATSAGTASAQPPNARRNRILLVAGLAVVAVALGALLADKFWLARRGSAQQPDAVANDVVSEKSIAVLPFTDMSEKKDQEYFSDGLSEELIDMLTKIPELRVPARTSSFYFKGKQATIADIAKALGVAHVLEGSVRKSGTTLRITAQLIRVDNGYHLWSETYDRKLDDIFKIQDEIAGAVVTALRVHLLPQQQAAARAAQEGVRTGNLAAYNLYLQGRQSYNQGNAAGYQGAVTAFQAATALDSHYAMAYADLAVAQLFVADNTGSTADSESGLAAAEKAVALAPGLAAGYSARGFVRAVYRFDFAGAQADLDKAVALNPNDASVLHRSALMLAFLGKLSAAIAREEQALALDPLSAEICMRLGFFLVANQQLEQARPLYEKALAIAPNSFRASFHLGKLALLENHPEQALVIFRQTGLAPFSLEGQAEAEYSLGHLDVSRRILEQLIAKYGKGSAYQIASVYAWEGDKDRVFEWLEKSYTQHDAGLIFIKVDPGLRGHLRSDPRYKALLRKMNLPE
jgi:TolB-like protein/Flp pilus assembly protein TadD